MDSFEIYCIALWVNDASFDRKSEKDRSYFTDLSMYWVLLSEVNELF